MWRSLLAFLASLTADPVAVDREAPRAAGAVAAAYATLANEPPPAPTPPKPGECCSGCKGTGFITHGDGHRTPCPCPPSCKCKKAACPDGKCPVKTVLP